MKTEKVREKYGLISKGTTVIKRLLNMAGGSQVRHPELNNEILRGACPERQMKILHFVQNDKAKSSE